MCACMAGRRLHGWLAALPAGAMCRRVQPAHGTLCGSTTQCWQPWTLSGAQAEARPPRPHHPRYLLKMRAEVEVMQQLGVSLNAVNLVDVYEDDVNIHMIMELCDG